MADWRANSGIESDLARLSDPHAAWLAARPGLARVDDTLLVMPMPASTSPSAAHRSGDEALATILATPDAVIWDGLLSAFTERHAFRDDPRSSDVLARFGGRRLRPGHGPIARLTGKPARPCARPSNLADGRAVALDPGLPRGGPGFLYRL